MNVVAITGPGQVELVNRPDPVVDDNYAVIRIDSAPMCTEWRSFQTGRVTDTLGHEAAGVVVAVGPRCAVRMGTRVVVMPQDPCGRCELCLAGNYIRCQSTRNPLDVCGSPNGRATFAQLCIQQDWMLLPIPDDVSTLHAAMACCGLGPAFGAIERMNVTPNDTVLVSGLGPVGLGVVICAAARGSRVIGLEPNPFRASLAKELGAECVIDPTADDAHVRLMDVTSRRGADFSVETSSTDSGPGFLHSCTKIGGQMASIGWGGPVNMRDIVGRGVSIFGQWHWNHVNDGEAMFRLIRRVEPLLDRFITHRFALSDVQKAFEVQASGTCGKVVLLPNGPQSS